MSQSLRQLSDSVYYRVWWDNETQILELEPHESLGYKVNHEKLSIKTLPDNVPKGRFPATWDKKKKVILANLTKS